jgi:hypothetical protein
VGVPTAPRSRSRERKRDSPKPAGSRDTPEPRHHPTSSSESQEKTRDCAHTNDRAVVITELESGVRLLVDVSDQVIGLNIVRGQSEREATELATAR